MALMVKKSAFIAAAERDKRVIKLRALTESGVFARVDARAMMRELLRYHAVKSVRALTSEKLLGSFQRVYTDNQLEILGFRSRCAEIKAMTLSARALLDEHIDYVAQHLQTRFALQLRNEFRTVTDRKAAVACVLADYYRTIKRFDNLIKVADTLIDDLDKNYWTLKAVADAFTNKIRES